MVELQRKLVAEVVLRGAEQCVQHVWSAYRNVGLPLVLEALRAEAALQVSLVCPSTTAHHFAPLT